MQEYFSRKNAGVCQSVCLSVYVPWVQSCEERIFLFLALCSINLIFLARLTLPCTDRQACLVCRFLKFVMLTYVLFATYVKQFHLAGLNLKAWIYQTAPQNMDSKEFAYFLTALNFPEVYSNFYFWSFFSHKKLKLASFIGTRSGRM